MNTGACRILVTGAGGQVGRALASAAWPSVAEARFLGRGDLDITVEAQVRSALDRHRPDLIINAAAFTDVTGAETAAAEAFRVNALGPAVLAQAATERGCRLIQVSTDFVFSGPGPHPENATPQPLNIYGASKLAGEHAVLMACPGSVVVRTAWVFDEHGPNFITRLLAQASAATLKVVDDEVGCPTSAETVAEGLVALAHYMCTQGVPVQRVFHLVNEGEASRLELARALFQSWADRGRPVPELTPVSARSFGAGVRRPGDSRLVSGSLGALTGWTPRTWRDALSRTVERIDGGMAGT